MSPPRSKIWQSFTKLDSVTAACKICFKHIKTSGNTSNLAKHLKQHRGSSNASSSSIIIDSESETGLSESDVIAGPSSTPGSPSSSKRLRSSLSTWVTTSISSAVDHPLGDSGTGELTTQMDKDNTANKNIGSSKTPDPTLHSFTPSIKDALKKITSYKEGGTKHAAITQCILYFICKDSRPFNSVTGAGFRKLMHELCPSYKIPHPDTFKAKLAIKYDIMKSIYEERLSKITYICLTFDMWTETMQTKSFLGVTAHFLTGVKLSSVTLATRQLFERHTSDNISEQLEDILNYWKINKQQIVGVVTDNGANVVSAVAKTFGRNKHMPCFAHTVNLIAEVITKDTLILPILGKVRDIVKWAKRSVTVSDKLRKIQLDNEASEGTTKKLILDVHTRWNSTFYMLKRFSELATTVNQIINDITAPPMLTATELDLARQIQIVLEPLEFVTREASGEFYITISKIIPMVNCLKNQLRKMTTELDIVNTLNTLKSKLIDEINKRFGKMEYNYFLSVSCILDPRFKRIHFEDPLGCSKTIEYIRKTIASQQTFSESDRSDSSKQGSPNMQDQEKYDFWDYHKTLAHAQNQKSQQTSSKINDELTVYLSNPVMPLNSDPMSYWEEVKNVFPGLYNIAVSHFCIVGTSVPSERLFSKAGGTVTQDRNRLSSNLLEKLLFLADCSEDEWFL